MPLWSCWSLSPLVLPAVPRLNAARFREIATTYHSRDSPGDTLTYLYIYRALGNVASRQTPPRSADLALLVNGYLRDWGKMGRVLRGNPDNLYEDPFYKSLARTLRASWREVRNLRGVTGWRVGAFSNELAVLFDSLVDETKNDDGAHSPVSAAKLLHMLLPNVCIIWDNEYVFKRGIVTRDKRVRKFSNRDGREYVGYVQEKFRQVEDAAVEVGLSVSEFSARVLSGHSMEVRRLVPGAGLPPQEPLTKILDEANYLGVE